MQATVYATVETTSMHVGTQTALHSSNQSLPPVMLREASNVCTVLAAGALSTCYLRHGYEFKDFDQQKTQKN